NHSSPCLTCHLRLMNLFRTRLIQLGALFSILRRFENPFLIILLRLGILKTPYFPYRIRNNGKNFTMLARPTTTSMADPFLLREVLVEEAYEEVLAFLNGNGLRV